MNGIAFVGLMALSFVQQTDTTFAVGDATRLSVDNPGGSITVVGWARPEIRIQAEHSRRTFIDVDRRGRTVDVEAEARRGPATIVDYTIHAPASMELDLEGTWSDITIEGMNGRVEAESMAGDVHVRGGRGAVHVETVQGEILVEGAQGRIEVEAVSRPVVIRDSSGEFLVESVGSTITFENVRATLVEAGTVGGRIVYDGTIQRGGEYFFGSHGGTVQIGVPAGTGATFTVATIHGTVTTDLPGAPSTFPRGERTRFEVGGGGALVEVETFGGRIVLRRR